MKKTVSFVMIFLLLSKVTGLLRETAIASAFGATSLTDIYKSALIIPGVVMSFFTVGLHTSLIPVLSSAEKNGEREKFFSNFFTVMMLFSTLAFVLLFVFAKPLAHVFVPGFKGEKFDMTVFYTRMIAVIAPLQIMTYTLIAWLQQRERFYIAAFVAIPMNLIIILGAYLSRTEDLHLIVYATIAGYIAQFLWVLIPYLKTKPKLALKVHFRDQYIQMFWVMLLPILLTLTAGQINNLIDRALASGLADGTVANMDNVTKVAALFQSVLVLSISSVLFTRQSKLSSEKNHREIYLVTKQNLSVILLIMIPVTFGVMFLSKEIMMLLFMRGRYTYEAAVIGGWLLLCYSGVLVSRAVVEIFAKMFFSLQETKKPMLSTFITIGTNIVLNLILVRFWGAYGLAIATSIASVVGMLVITYQARKYFHTEKIRILSRSMVKYLVSGAVMFVVLLGLGRFTQLGEMTILPKVMLSAVIGMSLYFSILIGLKTEEVFEIWEKINRRLRKRQA